MWRMRCGALCGVLGKLLDTPCANEDLADIAARPLALLAPDGQRCRSGRGRQHQAALFAEQTIGGHGQSELAGGPGDSHKI